MDHWSKTLFEEIFKNWEKSHVASNGFDTDDYVRTFSSKLPPRNRRIGLMTTLGRDRSRNDAKRLPYVALRSRLTSRARSTNECSVSRAAGAELRAGAFTSSS